MIKAHIYVDDRLNYSGRLQHCPRDGETLRVEGHNKYAKVTEIIWCIDEDSPEGQRVNIRAVSERNLGTNGVFGKSDEKG